MRSIVVVAFALIATVITAPAAPTSVYDFKVNALDGTPVDLAKYKGHVTLIVNTASLCGFTPQYAGLETLYTDYKDKDFFILGFPADNFGHQEPGDARQIGATCYGRFHVTFPMFEKVSVLKQSNQSPLYQFLTIHFQQPGWNFCKYLVDKNGKVLQYFPSNVTPEDPKLRSAIDAALKG